MAWFTTETLDFFGELELNNNREWFAANKRRYETFVKGPMEAFAGEMIQRMKEIDPQISLAPKDAVFRIYRDTRFSKDKTPYKTNAGMSITRGEKTRLASGIYFHIDARRMGIASGRYMMEPSEVAAVRAHIAGNLDEFERLLANPEFKARFGTITGERNKVLPSDLKALAERQPLLYNKQFYYWAEYDASEAMRDDLPEFVMAHARAAQPMNRFLSAASGDRG